jgi:hypothetical protein
VLGRELELLGAGALGGLLKRKARHAPEPGTPCANCDTELQGPYCHVCGQPGDNQHRSILHLAWEGIEGLTHLDGRLAQTLPPLLINPGKLAKDHFEGRRQRHVPPFRLFLICLLVFMFALESLFHGGNEKKHQEQHARLAASIQQKVGAKMAREAGDKPGQSDPKAISAALDRDNGTSKNDKVGAWLKPRLKKAIENKDYYLMVLFTWAHRLAILLLPILAGLLALVYIRRRKYFIYDHLIVAMQFLSFVFLISAAAWIIPDPVRGWAVLAASIWAPINLFQTLRGAYGSKWYTAVIKTFFLWTSTLFLFSVLMLGLMALALAEMA